MGGAVRRLAPAAGRVAGGLFAGVLGWALAAGLACNEPERPGLVDDVHKPRPEQPSLVDDDEPVHPDLLSPCGASTVELEFLRPNLYFAIDASASMLDDIPIGSEPQDTGAAFLPGNRYDALALAIQKLLERVGHRVNYGATLFPTQDVTCDSGEEILPLSAGDSVSFAVSGKIGPVLNELMFEINRRTPRGGTPVAATLRALLPKLRDHGDQTYVFLLTDGGPNCNRKAQCGPESCIPNLDHALLAENVYCEAPINCCDSDLFGLENCLDQDGSLLAVSALAQAGVRTFVIGIPGSDAFAGLLDQLALEGGVPRAGSSSYYRVSDADELVDTVSKLGLGVALSCSLQLKQPAPDPSLVNVFFDGQLVPADPVNGWGFVDARTVQLLGSSCDLLKAGEVLQADIVAGCPVVIH
jgi:hypothetical protein